MAPAIEALLWPQGAKFKNVRICTPHKLVLQSLKSMQNEDRAIIVPDSYL